MANHRQQRSSKVTAESLLRDVYDALKDGEACSFSMCTGPDRPPQGMRTCPTCWQAWRIKQFFARQGK